MKELIKGVNLLTAAEVANLPVATIDKLTSIGFTRLVVGNKYRILGYCKVDETKTKSGETIGEWYGYAVESVTDPTKKFAISVGTALSTYFLGKKPFVFGSCYQAPADVKKDTIFEVEAKDDFDTDAFGKPEGTTVKKTIYKLKKA